MKIAIFFLCLLCHSIICIGQKHDNSYFKRIDSILNSDLAKLYSFDSIKKNNDADDARISLNNEFKTNMFSNATITHSFHFLINDFSGQAELSVIEFEFEDIKICTRVYSLLCKKMGLDMWKLDEMLSCVKQQKNNLVFLYTGDISNHKIQMLMKKLCPCGHFDVHFIPTGADMQLR